MRKEIMTMSRMNRRALLAMCGVAPLAGALLARASDDEKPSPPKKSAREKIRERYFPNIVLRTHEDKEVRFYDDLIKDKIVVINFMYINCDSTCPITTHNLLEVQKLLKDRVGRDLFMYSITLKPEEDTPKALRSYAKQHGVGPGWLFLTGEPGDIEMLRRKQGFYDPDPVVDADTSSHVAMLRFGNEPLTLWGRTSGRVDPKVIAKVILWVDWPQNKPTLKEECCTSTHSGH
jgi:protein SCO1